MEEPMNTAGTIVRRSDRGLTLAGTRTTLYQIKESLDLGWSQLTIQERLNITAQQIADVLAYMQANAQAFEAEYQEVVREAEEIRCYWEERNRAKRIALATRLPKPGQEALVAKLRARKAELGMI